MTRLRSPFDGVGPPRRAVRPRPVVREVRSSRRGGRTATRPKPLPARRRCLGSVRARFPNSPPAQSDQGSDPRQSGSQKLVCRCSFVAAAILGQPLQRSSSRANQMLAGRSCGCDLHQSSLKLLKSSASALKIVTRRPGELAGRDCSPFSFRVGQSLGRIRLLACERLEPARAFRQRCNMVRDVSLALLWPIAFDEPCARRCRDADRDGAGASLRAPARLKVPPPMRALKPNGGRKIINQISDIAWHR